MKWPKKPHHLMTRVRAFERNSARKAGPVIEEECFFIDTSLCNRNFPTNPWWDNPFVIYALVVVAIVLIWLLWQLWPPH